MTELFSSRSLRKCEHYIAHRQLEFHEVTIEEDTQQGMFYVIGHEKGEANMTIKGNELAAETGREADSYAVERLAEIKLEFPEAFMEVIDESNRDLITNELSLAYREGVRFALQRVIDNVAD